MLYHSGESEPMPSRHSWSDVKVSLVKTTARSHKLTELANTINDEEGGLHNIVSPSSHPKGFPVTSLHFIELFMLNSAKVILQGKD